MNISRNIAHAIFRIRSFQKHNLKILANKTCGKTILEIGSGKEGQSFFKLFDSSNNFIKSDINEKYGHTLIDVTMNFKEKYDIILCLNVIEHIFDYEKAIRNIHDALKLGGIAVISVPAFYPLHDEPNDYWRFTEHSLKKMLGEFKEFYVKHSGFRKFPFAYYIEAKK